MVLSVLVWIGALVLGSHARADVAPPLPPNVHSIAGGFSWIENLCFDGKGKMYASERLRGQLLAFTPTGDYLDNNGQGSGEPGNYTMEVVLEGPFTLLLGCVTDEVRHPGIVFAVGTFKNGTHALVAVPAAQPAEWQVVAFTNHTGNGIRVHDKTGLIYTSTEGTFLPGSGAVYVIDPSKAWGTPAAAARTLVDGLWVADGLWIDQVSDVLYVGLMFSAELWTYSIADDKALGVFGGLNHTACGLLVLCALDDLTLDSTNSSWVIGAAWTNHSLARFPTFSPAPGHQVTTVLTGIQNPTSARWGKGPGFSPTSLFIAEGGGLAAGDTRFRILEWTQAANDF